jgi:hypothetical protein
VVVWDRSCHRDDGLAPSLLQASSLCLPACLSLTANLNSERERLSRYTWKIRHQTPLLFAASIVFPSCQRFLSKEFCTSLLLPISACFLSPSPVVLYISICLSIYMPTYLSTYLTAYVSAYLTIYLSIHPSICLSISLSIYVSNCISICPPDHPSIYLSISLSIYLSI